MSYREPAFMKEIHEIRVQNYEKTKNLSPEERILRCRQEAENFLKDMGYRFIKTLQGEKIEKITVS